MSFKNFADILLKKIHFFDNNKNYSYSQEGEDLILNVIFKDKEKGFYVDVGAYHPMKYSNTFIFYKKGWRGINIDPYPKAICLFNKKRPRDINLNYAVDCRTGTRTYYIYKEPAFNTLSKQRVDERIKKRQHRPVDKRRIKTDTLENLISRYVANISSKIYFFNIDVEGSELRVLKSNNWQKYRPKIIVVEVHHFDVLRLEKFEVHNYLSRKGYRFLAKTISTLFYQDDQ